MKKISILLIALFTMTITFAQKDIAEKTAGTLAPTTEEGVKAWKYGAGVGLFANQVALVNWSAGGVSSISGLLNGDVFADFRKGKHSWENNFRAQYGMIKAKHEDLTKNEDALELNSKYGYQVDKKGKVFVGGLLQFGSQFTQGYIDDEVKHSSNFLAPARLILAAGLDWKPNEMFSLFFSPAAGKITIVTDKGVDETAYGLEAGTIMRPEFGALLKVLFQKELMKNIKFKTGLSLFTDYLAPKEDFDGDMKSNFGNIDVDWLVGIDLVVNKWITVNLGTQLLYDHDTQIKLFDKNGNKIMNGTEQAIGKRTQFKEALNVGFTYRFVPLEDDKAEAKRIARKAKKAAKGK